jgi:hypothetical protein
MTTANIRHEEAREGGDPFQYRNVYVLLFTWENGDISTTEERWRLETTLRYEYGFKVISCPISWSPLEQRPETTIQRRLDTSKANLTPHDLLIFYYIGHGAWNSRNDVLAAKQ